ncbi:polymorphic toxin-type HINT domain-containing protein [Solirubrobacter deserti]|nr:polymorphic toxin-type HINT domain-containing protein [Solirubrobacter deserti]
MVGPRRSVLERVGSPAESSRLQRPNAALLTDKQGETSALVSSAPVQSAVGSGRLAPVDLGWRASASGFSLKNPPREVAVGASAPDGARFKDGGIGFAPVGAPRAPGEIVGGSVFYANVASDVDYLVAPRTSGLEAMFVLRSQDSPERVALEYRLEPGLTVRAPLAPGRSAEIVRGETVIGATTPVRAVDAEDVPVTTRESVVDGKLVIEIAHRGAGLHYPILIDPTVYYIENAVGFFQPDLSAPVQGSNGYLQYYLNNQSGTAPGDWGEFRYEPPGSAYVVAAGGELYRYGAGYSESVLGLRDSGGSWVPGSPVAAPDGAVTVCVIYSCEEPESYDSPTNDLSYFSGTQAVFRMDVFAPTSWEDHIVFAPWLQVDDPDVPTLSAVTGASGGWVGTASRTVSATASDGGLGAIAFELVRNGTVLATTDRTDCTPGSPATGGWYPSCSSNWAASLSYSASLLPDGASTLGVRARDAAGHVSALQTWNVQVDRNAPTVSFSGSFANPVGSGSDIGITGTDSSGGSGIAKVHVSVDGVAKPSIDFSCSGGCWNSRTGYHSLDPASYSEGLHTITVRAEDAAGNLSTALTRNIYVVHPDGLNRGRFGLENFFAYESTPTGAGTAAHVNAANGNLVWHSTPVVNPGRGLSSVVNLTYNSQDRGAYVGSLIREGGTKVVGYSITSAGYLSGTVYGEAGHGFSLGISGLTRLNEPLRRLAGASADDPSTLGLTDVDGTYHEFWRVPNTNRFSAPAGVELAFRIYSTTDPARKFAATRPDGVTFFFDTEGYQTYITDRNNNTIRFDYERYSKVTGNVSDCNGSPSANLLCTKRVIRVVDPYGVQHGGAETAKRSLTISYRPGPTLPTGSHTLDIHDVQALAGPVGGRAGRISRIVDHAGRVTDFGYDADGYLTTLKQGEVVSPNGTPSTAHVRTTTLTYAGSGPNRQLASVIDPRGNDTTLAYETPAAPGAAGVKSVGMRSTSITNRRDHATAFSYDDPNRCFTATAPVNRDTKYCTDTVGRAVTITDELGTVTEMGWSTDNYMTRYEVAANRPEAAETEITYTRLGDPVTITDPLDRVTTLSYRFGTESGPTNGGLDDGTQYVTDLTSLRRPARGNTFLFPAPTVTFGLDNAGNVTSRTYAGLAPAQTEYGSYGLINWEEDEHDNRTSYSSYDANGMPTVVVDPRQNAGEAGYDGTWRYNYDPVGNLLAVTDPRGGTSATPGQPYTTSFVYDAFDRVRESWTPKCTDPSNDPDEGCPTKTWSHRLTEYDANGNPTRSTDAEGAHTDREFTAMDAVSFELAPAVNHHGEQDPAREKTSYDYDARENVTLVTSPEGSQSASVAGDHATAYEYDAIDRLVVEQRQSRGDAVKNLITSYAYDWRDNVVGVADPLANKVGDAKTNAASASAQRWLYRYDLADNRVDQIENPDASGGVPALRTFRTFDANNNLASVISPRGMTLTGPNGTAAEFTTTFQYDVHDDVTLITRGGQRTTAYARRDDGRITAITSPRGVASTTVAGDFQTAYTYDRNGDVATVTLPRAPGQVPSRAAKVKYGRNAVGDPIDIKDPRGNDEANGTPAPPAHYFSNRFYDTGELRWTDRPSWWTVEPGGQPEVRERTPDEWLLFDGSRPQLPQGPGDFGKVTGMPLPDLLPMAGGTELRYDGEMRLESVVDVAGKVIDLRRDDLGRIKGIEYPYKADDSSTTSVDEEVRIPAEFGFDRNGNLVMSEDGEGEQTVTEFDQFDRWVKRTSPGALTDGGDPDDDPLPTGGFLEEVTEATWDENGNQTVFENARNNATTSTYDAVDRLRSVKDPLDHVTTYDYDANGNQTCERMPRGNTSTSTTCAAGDFTTIRDYTRFDELKTVSQQAGYESEADQVLTTTFAYDLDGNQITVTAPGARRGPGGGLRTQVTERRYDGAGRPLIVIEGSKHTGDQEDAAFDDRTVTVMEYDLSGNLRRVVNPRGAPNPDNINLDNPGAALAALTNDDGSSIPPVGSNPPATAATYHATVFSLNEDNHLRSTWLPVGANSTNDSEDDVQWRSIVERDQRGRVKWIDAPYRSTTANRARTGYYYYDNGWIRESTDEYVVDPNEDDDDDGLREGAYTYDFDKRGLQVKWDAEGPRSVTRHYYPNGQLLRRIATGDDTGPRRYSYGYNRNRSTISIRQTNDGRETHSVYDVAERLTEVNEVDTNDSWDDDKDTFYDYDADDNITVRKTDGNLGTNPAYSGGKTSTFEYDSIGRERKVTVDTSNQADRITRTTWWPAGRKANVLRQNGEVCQRTYFDTQGRVTARGRTTNADERGCEHAETNYRYFEYDGNSNRKDEYRWSNATPPTRVFYNRHEYNSRNQLVWWKRGVDARPVDRPHPEADEPVVGSEVKYKLNGAGATTQIRDERANNHVIETDFDVVGYRLKTARYQDTRINNNAEQTQYFKYDSAGNLACSSSTDSSNNVDNCAGGTRLRYDGFSRLTSTEGASTDKRYEYDGLDRRDNECVRATSGCASGTTREHSYVGMTEQLSRTRDPSDSNDTVNTYDYDSALGRIGQASDDADQNRHDYHSYFTDPANGNVIGLEDPAGTIDPDDRYDLNPYGEQENPNSPSVEAGENPFRFQGHHYDGGIRAYDMQARSYLPSIGRFSTADRFEDALGDFALQSDHLTQERYAFGAGNPVNRVEFDGHRAADGDCTGMTDGKGGYRNCKARPPAPTDTPPQPNPPDHGPGSDPTNNPAQPPASPDAGKTPTGGPPPRFSLRNIGTSDSPPEGYELDRDIEDVHLTLDGLGLFPWLGEPADLANCGIYAVRGKKLDAGLSCGAAVPGLGWGATAGKWSKRGVDGAKSGAKVAVDSVPPQSAGRQLLKSCTAIGGLRSFSATTGVLMADGTLRPISQIRVGDRVMAADPLTGVRGWRRVLAVWSHDDTLVDLTIGSERLTTTEDHPFWNATDGEWQDAADLTPGDSVFTVTGERISVGGVRPESLRQGRAYNLSVEDLHTYFVGEARVLVHNDSCAVEPASDVLRYAPTHGLRAETSAYMQSLSNDELLALVNNAESREGILVTPGGKLIGGHHRVGELRRRIEGGSLDPNVKVRVETLDY